MKTNQKTLLKKYENINNRIVLKKYKDEKELQNLIYKSMLIRDKAHKLTSELIKVSSYNNLGYNGLTELLKRNYIG